MPITLKRRVRNHDLFAAFSLLFEDRLFRFRRRICHAVVDPARGGDSAQLDIEQRIDRYYRRVANDPGADFAQ